MSERVVLTDSEKRLLADHVLGGAEPSALMVRAVERIVAARVAASRKPTRASGRLASVAYERALADCPTPPATEADR